MLKNNKINYNKNHKTIIYYITSKWSILITNKFKYIAIKLKWDIMNLWTVKWIWSLISVALRLGIIEKNAKSNNTIIP